MSVLYAQSVEPVENPIEETIIANNSGIDFSSLPTLANHPFIIKNASFESMNNGEISLLLSTKKWTDEHMADYKQSHQHSPLLLTIAAFSDLKDASMEQQAEIFSGRAGDQILYLYITALIPEPQQKALALHFSETVQPWFVDQNLMAIPERLQERNRVVLGLLAPQFADGYK